MFRQRRVNLKATFRFNRTSVLLIFIFLFTILLVSRLFQIQILNHSAYKALALKQHEVLEKVAPERGGIYFQDHYSSLSNLASQEKFYPLAQNIELTLVYAVPKEIEDPENVAQLLSPLLGLTQEELLKKISSKDDPYEPLKHKVREEKVKRIKDLNLKGIGFEGEVFRYYSEGKTVSHILGFLGYEDSKKRGQYGLEEYFEKELAGKPGEFRMKRDSYGRLVGLGEELKKPIRGVDLILTLDRTIQFIACDKLERRISRHGAQGGTVIVMEPKTGRILAMCSYPNFDPNYYSEVENLDIFINPAISKTYEPGSIFKPITLAGALETGLITPETTYEDEGEVKIGQYTIRNSDGRAHGLMSMSQVIERSLNTGAIFVVRKLGPDLFKRFVQDFGFGELSGIELQGETKGDISSLKEKGEIFRATASFGQGISATPLQITQAFGAIANQGKLMKPYIIEEQILSDGKKIKAESKVVRQVISPETATTLGAMLVSVVERGHGRLAGVKGYRLAGKTGTAQVPRQDGRGYDPSQTIGSFVGFGPYEDPRFVIFVKIDNPRDVIWAESSAAPLFGEIADFLLRYFEIPPEEE